MTLETALFLVAIGLVGGAWNAIAGGATLFTFPALMSVGLPPVVANATNYLAMLPSNAAALPAYRRELFGIGPAIWPLIVVSGLGAVAGSLLLLASGEALFERLIPILILAATGLFAFGDRFRRSMLGRLTQHGTGRLAYVALFLFSIYGGYFGAGLGIVLLALVQLLGFGAFHVANSLKNLLATSFTILSILVFGLGGIVAWPEAAVTMLGSAVGGYLGAHFGRGVDERLLRIAVIAFGLVLSLVYVARYWLGTTFGAG
ncbi:MAG: sulfite exporter TauE/SafE family protein [Pseudomonadota bacterium]